MKAKNNGVSGQVLRERKVGVEETRKRTRGEGDVEVKVAAILCGRKSGKRIVYDGKCSDDCCFAVESVRAVTAMDLALYLLLVLGVKEARSERARSLC